MSERSTASKDLRARLVHQMTHTEIMTSKLEKIIDLYRDLCKIPSIVSGTISRNADEPNTISVNSLWSQRDIVRNDQTKFSRKYFVQLGALNDQKTPSKVLYRSNLEELNEIQRTTSRSQTLTAVLRSVAPTKRSSSAKAPESSQILDIYNKTIGAKECSIDLKATEKHGKVHSGEVSSLQWSYGEGHLLYVAEKFRKPVNYFDPKFDAEKFDDDNEEFLYRESWGEQMSEVVEPCICILDVPSGNVTVLDDLPSNISPFQPIWTPNDEGIIFVGIENNPAKLGYIYCFNRRSRLYYYNLQNASCEKLTETDSAIYQTSFSPDGSKFVYFEGRVGGPHKRGETLKCIQWPSKIANNVVDIVDRPKDEDEFPGLYAPSFPRRCWANDNTRVVFDCIWRSKTEIGVVNVNTKRLVRLTNIGNVHGSWQVLDLFDDVILAACSSPNRPPCLLLARLPAENHEDTLVWLKLDKDNPHPFERLIQDISWEILGFKRSPIDGEVPYLSDLQYEGIFLRPKKASIATPLLVVPHGGPHSAYTASWLTSTAFFVSLGYSVLRINYRGSIGFGEDFLNSLPSHIGVTDVLDCHHAVDATLEGCETLNKNAVVAMGGSHGGFLTAHLIGQFPQFYKAAVALNPVINLAAIITTGDIPDWAVVECFNRDYDMSKPITGDELAVMYNMSPIRYVENVETPILFLIGEKDLRVPPSQFKEYVRVLKARKVNVRVLMYPENSHPIASVDADCNLMINSVRWFEENLSEQMEDN